jgi:hypothetical protein
VSGTTLSPYFKANINIVAAVDREEIDALDDLKATNQIITSSLQNDLLLLQSKHKNITTDFEQQKSHLVDALLAKDKLRQELAIMKEGKDSAGEEDRHAAEENSAALQALKEVSHANNTSNQDLSPPRPPPPCLTSSLSFHPFVFRASPVKSTGLTDEGTLLSLERTAIGSPVRPRTGHSRTAMPISPMPPLNPRNQVFRASESTGNAWANATTVTDNIRSKPKNKNKLSKIWNDGLSWLKKAA